MRTLFSFVFVVVSVFLFGACKSSSTADKPSVFCDTTCNNDTIKVSADNKEKSFVRISMKDCDPDSITWGNQLMDTYRQMQFGDLVGKDVKLNKNFVRIFIFDTRYAWLLLNECEKGQGFIIKLPFNDTANIFRKSSGFNPMDMKYKVHESLVAYTDKGNIFVEEMATGKTAMMTFGVQTDLEYDAMHETVESVEITPARIWAKVKIGKEWKEIEKEITLK